jgi:HAD superfamily hydrolase (TIGR01509 family)
MATFLKNRIKPDSLNLKRKIKVVAFDCDGVMFDSTEANRAYYNHILSHFGKPDLSEEQFAFTHMHTADISMAYLFGDKESLEKAQAFRKKMTYMPFIKHMRMEPYLETLLESLRSKYKTAIASNRTDTMNRVLEIHGLEGKFDLVVSAMDVPRPKPYPDELLKILEHFNADSDEIIYVGDSKVDEDAAKAAQVPLVAYRAPDLEADLHVQSFKELEQILM